MHNKFADEKPSTELYLSTVVDREACGKHQAKAGVPCWIMESSVGFLLQGICNKRAKKAGFNHKVSDKSMRLRPTKK